MTINQYMKFREIFMNMDDIYIRVKIKEGEFKSVSLTEAPVDQTM